MSLPRRYQTYVDAEDPIYSYFQKGCRKKYARDILKGNMGYDQYAVPDTVAVQTSIVAFL